MKKLYAIIGILGAILVPSLHASITATLMDDQTTATGYSQGDGGEFAAVVSVPNNVNWAAYNANTSGLVSLVQVADAAATGWGPYSPTLVNQPYFQTFCIQTAVYFTPGQSYTATSADSITGGTAWLYSQFASGGLASYGYDYTYGTGRMSSAGALQQAIWYFQGQSGGANNSFANDAFLALGAAAFTDSGGLYGVRGFDLTGAGGVAAQDQLFITAVPEPSTVISGLALLVPFGASTLRVLRKKVSA